MIDESNSSVFIKRKPDQLSPEAYQICWLKRTEPAFSGQYNNYEEEGSYYCVWCNNLLFSSPTKYKSGSGWPSFWDKASPQSVCQKEDFSHGMNRTEVLCQKCGAHLGHVFNDGPQPTGQRYCINSVALIFKASKSL